MKTEIVFTVATFISVHVFASETLDKFQQIPLPSWCQDVRDGAEKLQQTKSKDPGKILLKSKDYDQALSLLEKIKSPRQSDVDTALAALKENTDASVLKFVKLSGASCWSAQVSLSRMILSSVEQSELSKAQKVKGVKLVLDHVMAVKYPTVIGVIIDANILLDGSDKKLLKISTDDRAALARIKVDAKAFGKKISAEGAKLPGSPTVLGEDDAAQAEPEDVLMKKLTTTPEFQAHKHIFIDEAEQTVQYRKELSEITKRVTL